MDFGELLERSRRGDSAAEEELYRLLKPVIQPMIARMLRESAARRVLDPTDVFHTALRRLMEQEVTPANLPAWLVSVARHRVLELQRSHGVSRTESQSDALKDSRSPREKRPDEQAESLELLSQARRALGEEIYQSLLHIQEGGSWIQAAAQYAPPGTSPEAWRKRCERRCEDFRRSLGARDEEGRAGS